MAHRALFLDRDGTLTHARHYPSHPADLQLYDGIEAGLLRMQAAGWLIVVITNQSGIARGYFDEATLHEMHAYLADELARSNVHIDGFYHCPHHPDGSIAELAVRCDCRKPAPGMLLRAAADLAIDLERSWFVGDVLSDVEAGNRAGCRTVLVDLGSEASPTRDIHRPDFVARSTVHALALIAAVEHLGPEQEMTYRPARWAASPVSEGAAQ